MKKITKARKERIKFEMQRLYQRMEELGMTPNRSSVSIEFFDAYDNGVMLDDTGVIASMAKVAQEMSNNWLVKGLNGLPDQVVFTVNDREGFGSGDLIVSLENSYIGFVVYDNDLNEIG